MLSFLYRHLTSISLLFLLMSGFLLAGASMVMAQEEDSTQSYCDLYRLNRDQMMEDIFEASGFSLGADMSEAFSGSSPGAKDLYLHIYKAAKYSTRAEAMKEVAAEYQYSVTEFCSILGGNIALLSYTQDNTVEYADLLELLEEMRDDYEKAVERYEFQQQMTLDVYPKEVFANGDTNDSGFDVLYDLEIIEYILFNEDTFTLEGDGDSPSFDFGDDDDDSTPVGDDDDDDDDNDDSVAGDDDDDNDDSVPEDEEESVDPNECAADSEVQAAFAGLSDDDDDDDSTPVGDDDDDDDDDDNDDSAPVGDDDDDDSYEDDEDPWAEPKLCNSFFCLFIRFTNQPDPDYETTANCVKCHVDYMVEALEETVSHTLNPGKLSGNIIEPSMCKRSMMDGGISLNFIAVAMPLPTPPADNLVTGVNIWENFADFVEETWPPDHALWFAGEDETEIDDKALINHYDNMIRRAILKEADREDPGLTSEELLIGALDEYQTQLEEINESFEKTRTRSRFMAEADFYTSVRYELDAMIVYFSSYQTTIGLTETLVAEFARNLKSAS